MKFQTPNLKNLLHRAVIGEKNFGAFRLRKTASNSLEEALQTFKDKTGLPAPRSWTNQTFPENKADFPVTDITWYEAAAYAEFRGKKLPTVFQWEKAARDGAFDARYNALPWGFIRQGETTDNFAPIFAVRNCCGYGKFRIWNESFRRVEYGGKCVGMELKSIARKLYHEWRRVERFGVFVWRLRHFPGLYSANRIGFRLVSASQNDQGAQMIPPAETSRLHAFIGADFKTWLTHYDYDKKRFERANCRNY